VRQILKDAGFCDIVIIGKDNSEEIIKSWNTSKGAEHMVFSAYIHAVKPEING